MKCIICGKSNGKSLYAEPAKSTLLCNDCSNKKHKECNILKTDFYKYKNNRTYSICIECFNEKVKCEYCIKEFNETYLSEHIKKLYLNIYNNENHNGNHFTNTLINNSGENHNDENHNDNNMFNRTLIVGPPFCGKTQKLLNKLHSSRMDNLKKYVSLRGVLNNTAT